MSPSFSESVAIAREKLLRMHRQKRDMAEMCMRSREMLRTSYELLEALATVAADNRRRSMRE
jgi:hypothetical protein